MGGEYGKIQDEDTSSKHIWNGLQDQITKFEILHPFGGGAPKGVEVASMMAVVGP